MPLPPTPEALTAIRAVLQACVLLASSLFITGSFWGGQAALQQVNPYSRAVSRNCGWNRMPLSCSSCPYAPCASWLAWVCYEKGACALRAGQHQAHQPGGISAGWQVTPAELAGRQHQQPCNGRS